MDFVSRLKKLIEIKGLSTTQFADVCGIPRPTISQIINGRNKKISDELIGKIHAAFPSVSVVWLMFGEGSMEIVSNIKISEPQNPQNSTNISDGQFDNKTLNIEADLFSPYPTSIPSRNDANSTEVRFDDSNEIEDIFSNVEQSAIKSKQTDTTADDMMHSKAKELNRLQSKQISSIVVFYTDNTFDTFTPKSN